MAIKTYRPTTPGRRGMTTKDVSELTAKKPVRSLLKIRKSTAGRNNKGRITSRHRGGGAKRFYRLLDFNYAEHEGVVEAIEYDPNRSAHIARVKVADGTYRYLLAGSDMKVGKKLRSGKGVPVESGNRLTLEELPTGSYIYNIELQPGKGGQVARSAGASAQLMAKEGGYAQVKLPSGEVRLVNLKCMATLGSVGNVQHQNVKLGSAGRNRRMGRRPHVRGVVMNAADHPHGGGDGGRHGSGKPPRTPWGQPTLGYRTRRRKSSAKLIVRSRHEAKRR